MAWLESHQNIWRHPKTMKLARILGATIPTAVGHLHGLWYWCMDYAPDGVISDFDAEDVALAAMWEGEPQDFISALIKTRFVDDENGVLRIHNWSEYTGKLLEKQAKDRERKRTASGTSTETRRNSTETRRNSTEDLGNITNITNITDNDITDTTSTPASGDAQARAEERPASGAAAVAEQRETVPYKKILEFFNTTCTRLSAIKSIEGQRQKSVSARFKTHGLDAIITVFKKTNASDFLCGGGSKNFIATFDWIMKPDNFLKILEGNYDNRSQPPPQEQSRPPTNGRVDPFAEMARREVENVRRIHNNGDQQ